uniref:RT_RNaseH_2 domain-containing protein n=1 Tax=Caenorhabditis japonica TaxID=281687 RepID=A0A8R1I3S2_CAEJA
MSGRKIISFGRRKTEDGIEKIFRKTEAGRRNNFFFWKTEDGRRNKKNYGRRNSAPLVLAQPDVDAAVNGNRPFLIYTDASRKGVGAVLAQEDENGEQCRS